MDMNRVNEARDMTKKLGLLAEKYKCAIVIIGHMNKAAGNKAAYRGMGSIENNCLKSELAETNNAMKSNEIFSIAEEQGVLKGQWKMPRKS